MTKQRQKSFFVFLIRQANYRYLWTSCRLFGLERVSIVADDGTWDSSCNASRTVRFEYPEDLVPCEGKKD